MCIIMLATKMYKMCDYEVYCLSAKYWSILWDNNGTYIRFYQLAITYKKRKMGSDIKVNRTEYKDHKQIKVNIWS